MGFPKKITELPLRTVLKNTDLFVSVDTDTDSTNKVTLESLATFIGGGNQYVTGGTYNEITESIDFVGNSGFPSFSVNVSGLTEDTYVTGATLNVAILEIGRNNGEPLISIDLSSLSGDTNTFVSGATLVGTTYSLEKNDGTTIPTDFEPIISGKVDTTLFNVYTANTETEINSKLDITTFDTYTANTTDNVVTGATLVGTTLELERNNGLSGVTVDLSPLSGTTPSLQEVMDVGSDGVGINTPININTTDDDISIYAGGLTKVITVGSANEARLIGQETVWVYGQNDWALVSSGQHQNSNNPNAKISLSGTSVSNEIGQVEISAYDGSLMPPVSGPSATIFLDGVDQSIRFSGNDLGTPSVGDVLSAKDGSGKIQWVTLSADTNTFITGTSLNNTTYTINQNNGTSFSTDFESIISGKVDTTLFNTYTANTETEINSKLDITTFDTYTANTVDNNIFVVSGEANAATQQLTFTNTSGGTFNVVNAAALFSDNDINVTGGTYDNNTGCVTFSTNSGTTFPICGFITGLTDTYTTSGVYDNNTGEITFTRTDASTYTVDLSTLDLNDKFVSGGTYNSGTTSFDFVGNNGFPPFSVGVQPLISPFEFGTGVAAVQPRDSSYNNSTQNTVWLGGTVNKIMGDYNFIGNGLNHSIEASADYSFIGNGNNNQLGDGVNFLSYSAILAGKDNTIEGTVSKSAIIAGENNTITHSNTFILGSNISSTQTGTTYVENLNVGSLGSGISVNNLGIDASGNVVVGSSGTSSTDTYVTGATLNGNTLELERNNSLTAVTVDLSSLSATTPTIDEVISEGNQLSNTNSSLQLPQSGSIDWSVSSGNQNFIVETGGSNGYIRIYNEDGELEMGDSNRITLASFSGSDLELKTGGNTDDFRIYLGTNGPSIGDVLEVKSLDGNTGLMGWGTPNDVFVTSGEADAATQQLTFTNNSGGTFSVTNAAALFTDNDINVTGGTYDNNTGCVTFFTNSGTSFPICGFVTGLTDTYTTSGTYDNNTAEITFNRTDASTYTVDLSTLDLNDKFITGFTYNDNNTLTITDNEDNSFSTTINQMSGLTITNFFQDVIKSGSTYEFNKEFKINLISDSDPVFQKFKAGMFTGATGPTDTNTTVYYTTDTSEMILGSTGAIQSGVTTIVGLDRIDVGSTKEFNLLSGVGGVVNIGKYSLPTPFASSTINIGNNPNNTNLNIVVNTANITGDTVISGDLTVNGEYSTMNVNEFSVSISGDNVFSVGQLGTQDVKVGELGISDKVDIGGDEITIDTNTLNLNQTLSQNNTETQLLVRNATTGNIEYRDSSTLSGGGSSFTGNTSGTCISELWVSSISGCSPVNIGTGLEVEGGLTVDGAIIGTSPFSTKAGGDEIEWDYATDGPNIKVVLSSGSTNILTVDNVSTFPNGTSGYIIIDPSSSTDYKLPDESFGSGTGIKSYLSAADAALGGSNPVRLQYTYDGTNFWFDKFTNMIEPIYPPSVNFDTTDLIAFYHPESFNQAVSGGVSGGFAVPNISSSILIGDLAIGSDVTNFDFTVRDDTINQPAFWTMGDDENEIITPSTLGATINTNNTVSFYMKGPYQTGYCGLIDFYDGSGIYEETLYLYNKDFRSYDPSFTFSYPELLDYSGDGGADLTSEWLFVSYSIDESSNELTLYVGCQSSLDAARAASGATNWDYSGLGDTVSVDEAGLYKETSSQTIDETTFDRFYYGNSAGGGEGALCSLGMLGIYSSVIPDSRVTSNWESTRATYYIN